MSPKQRVVLPAVDSRTVFRTDLFNGKVLFCTGGGSGICKGMTRAVMLHGANAAIVGRNFERLKSSAEELSKETHRECLAAQADVRRPEQLREAVKKTIERFGRIDFVVCGAAGNFLAPISGLSENGFKTVLDIDALGSYNTVKATLPYVRESRGSYIMVSTTMHYKATPYQVHVSAAKAAVDAVSAVVAVEEGPNGVRSNVLTPGPIAGSEGMDRLSSVTGGATGVRIPAGRQGDNLDVGNAAIFLLSDAASYVTGQIFVIDGGERHLSTTQLPYPEAFLDPDVAKGFLKSRL